MGEGIKFPKNPKDDKEATDPLANSNNEADQKQQAEEEVSSAEQISANILEPEIGKPKEVSASPEHLEEMTALQEQLKKQKEVFEKMFDYLISAAERDLSGLPNNEIEDNLQRLKTRIRDYEGACREENRTYLHGRFKKDEILGQGESEGEKVETRLAQEITDYKKMTADLKRIAERSKETDLTWAGLTAKDYGFGAKEKAIKNLAAKEREQKDRWKKEFEEYLSQ